VNNYFNTTLMHDYGADRARVILCVITDFNFIYF